MMDLFFDFLDFMAVWVLIALGIAIYVAFLYYVVVIHVINFFMRRNDGRRSEDKDY